MFTILFVIFVLKCVQSILKVALGLGIFVDGCHDDLNPIAFSWTVGFIPRFGVWLWLAIWAGIQAFS